MSFKFDKALVEADMLRVDKMREMEKLRKELLFKEITHKEVRLGLLQYTAVALKHHFRFPIPRGVHPKTFHRLPKRLRKMYEEHSRPVDQKEYERFVRDAKEAGMGYLGYCNDEKGGFSDLVNEVLENEYLALEEEDTFSEEDQTLLGRLRALEAASVGYGGAVEMWIRLSKSKSSEVLGAWRTLGVRCYYSPVQMMEAVYNSVKGIDEFLDLKEQLGIETVIAELKQGKRGGVRGGVNAFKDMLSLLE